MGEMSKFPKVFIGSEIFMVLGHKGITEATKCLFGFLINVRSQSDDLFLTTQTVALSPENRHFHWSSQEQDSSGRKGDLTSLAGELLH